ncbi:MAG: M56 family metallopeptidase [Alistipes sp.]|jgi:TonB family protein|nr:M56 family metallopeptidase [Alistipes sp.]
MSALITYALGVAACSGVFTLFYRTVLHRRTTFAAARTFLLTSLVAAAIIPALEIPVWSPPPAEAQPAAPMIEVGEITFGIAPDHDFTTALWILYTLGAALLAIIMARQALRIERIRRRADWHSIDRHTIAVSGEVETPFSFLSTIYVGRGTPPDDLRQIVMHEGSHIRHRHSAEKIAMEVLKSAQWFNPFAWWLSRLLAEVHEFEADRDVLDGGATVEEYLPLIFRQIFGYVPELSVGLGDSLTKKRFLMMKSKMRPTKNSWLRVAGVLPFAAGLVMVFSCTARPSENTAAASAAQNPVPEGATLVTPPTGPEGDIPIFNAEQMPTFQDGDLAVFRNWVASRLQYPKEAVEQNITGTVTLQFVIERDGSLGSVEVLASPHQLLSDEAVRVVSSSPKWSPGLQKGKPVRVWYIMPLQFSLAEAPSAD